MWPMAPQGEVSRRYSSRGMGFLWLQLPDYWAVVSSEWLGKMGAYGILTSGLQVTGSYSGQSLLAV